MVLAGLVAVAAAVAPSAAIAAPANAIRTGGPSAPAESKVAIVGSNRALAGKRFMVLDRGGGVARRGQLRRAAGTPAPWRHAYGARLGSLPAGSYRVRVPALDLTSRPWIVKPDGSAEGIDQILRFFAANRDGNEPSPIHDPSHLHDATVRGGPHDGERFDLTGGWMDAGDMIHFAQTTSFAAAILEASARLDPARAPELDAEAGVGIRWLLEAHPAPSLFVAQVGDQRDHDLGFRDPADDDASPKPGIGRRRAYPGIEGGGIGGDIAGKAAAALALAYDRSGAASELTQARAWYAAGRAAARPTPQLPGGFYGDRLWKDSMAGGAAALYRSTGEQHYLSDAIRYLRSDQSAADGTLGVVDSFASFAAADLCGALGAPPLGPAGRSKPRLPAPAAVRRDRRRAGPGQRLCHAGVLQLGNDCPERRQRSAGGAGRLRERPRPGTGGRRRRPRLPAGTKPVRPQLRGRLRAPAPRGIPTTGPRSSATRCRRGGGRGPGADRPDPRAGVPGSRPARHPVRRLRGSPRRLRHLRARARLRGLVDPAAGDARSGLSERAGPPRIESAPCRMRRSRSRASPARRSWSAAARPPRASWSSSTWSGSSASTHS